MNKAYLAVTAAALIGGTLFMQHADAASVGGGFSRATNASPAQGSGCRTSVGASGLRVQTDANLNAFGANVNIRPPIFGCSLRQTNHHSEMISDCFNGLQRFGSANGTAFSDADIYHDCLPYGGGKAALWVMNAP